MSPDLGRCRRCPALMEWAITEAKGRRIPLEPATSEPDPGALPGTQARRGLTVDRGNGPEFVLANLLVVATRGGLPVVRVVEPGAGDRVGHHSTCPEAKAFRRKKKEPRS